MSQEVLEAQQWLNSAYANKPGYIAVEETGLPGTATSEALVSALQIELEMGTVTGVFGDQTYTACDNAPLAVGSSGNRVKILQYGLYSKGYNPGSASGTYDSSTLNAVREIQEDAGLMGSQVSNTALGLQMKAILGVDEYKLVSSGDVQVRLIQQALNHEYLDYSGLCAADGIYGRSTNTALIYALQAEEGLPIGVANGNFGPTTRSCCPDLGTSAPQYGYDGSQYPQSSLTAFTKLVQYALYCNGIDRYTNSPGSKYDPQVMNGILGSSTLEALNLFQADSALQVRNMVGIDEWMSLLVSTGNPYRNGSACDCSTQLTAQKVQALIGDDYEIVGRYLTGTVGGGASKRDKFLTSEEIQTIVSNGLSIFCIYQDDEDWWQDHDDLSGYFGYTRGYQDAERAVLAAHQLGVPHGELIFFAVDYDYMEGEVYQKVVPHFEGINDYFSSVDNPYRIGIYSARNTCGIVCAQSLAESSFVSDMSTGYSGNLGFPLPSNWAFDQIHEYTLAASDGSFGVDKNVVSGRYEGFDVAVDNSQITALQSWGDDQVLTIPTIDPQRSNRLGLSAECGYFGSSETGDGKVRGVFKISSAAIATTITGEAEEVSSLIEGMSISVSGQNGVTFDTSYMDGKAACSPPLTTPSTPLDQVAQAGIKKLLSAVLIRLGLQFAGLVLNVAEVLVSMGTQSTVSNWDENGLSFGFNWQTKKAQTSAALVFYPIFDENDPSQSVTITVSATINPTTTSTATITVQNPFCS